MPDVNTIGVNWSLVSIPMV